MALVAYIVGAALLIRWDEARTGEEQVDLGADLYAMYTQLFFEPTANLPRSPVARVVFWLTPLLGAGLILRGVVRVGGSLFDVEERKRLWVKIMIGKMDQHVVVCGIGHVGIRVLESLKLLGTSVVAIERDSVESFAAVAAGMGIPVLYGDVRKDALLIEAGVRRAKAIVCATDQDLANLEVAIDAKRENPGIRVVMRMFDQRLAGKMRDALDVDEIFSTSALSGPLVALQATEPGVLAVYGVEGGALRVTMELEVPSRWIGRTVGDWEESLDARVLMLKRAGATSLRARDTDTLATGDVVTIDLPTVRLASLRR